MRAPFTIRPTAAALAATLLVTVAPTVLAQETVTTTAASTVTTVYFTRHAEKRTTTTSLGDANDTYELSYDETGEGTLSLAGDDDDASSAGDNRDAVCGIDKCAEELSDLGLLRAELLADYFDSLGVVDTLDAVYSSHKFRTRQTVEPTAEAAGLEVVQLPRGASELEPEGTGPSECPTVQAILSAPPGSTLLVAGHSGTLYDIMGGKALDDGACTGLGLYTADDERFPKDAKGKVRDFGDIWTVTIENGSARLESLVNLQPTMLEVVRRVD